MILGILSDTHGRADLAAAALRTLKASGANAFVHCGDIGGPSVFDALAGNRVWFVWGNSDEPGPRLTEYVRTLGLPLPESVPLVLTPEGRRLAVFHGHERRFGRIAEVILQGGDAAALDGYLAGCHYLLYGHTHSASDVRVGQVRCINSGALHRVATRSVATLDLQHDVLRFWEVELQRDNAAPRELPWAQCNPPEVR